MTREEAIQALNEIFDDSEFSRYEAWYGGAMDMAIEALSADAEDRHYIKIYADDEPSVKAEKLYQREWIIGCIKHDGFIKTDRFDKANQIILDALQTEVVRCKDCKHRYVTGHTTNYYICDFMDAEYEDNGFCHHGERREE